MKMLTAVLMLSLLAIPVFAGGNKDTMENDSMEVSMSEETGLIPPFHDFMDLESAAMKADTEPTVLFFYATWCPSCKAAAKELKESPEKLDGINLLIVDYDNSDELQKKYGVTYQHTFVLIDSDGEAIDTWNGGNIDDIVMHTEKGMM